MDNVITEAAPLVVALILALCMMAGGWVGVWIGRRHPTHPEDKSAERIVDGCMALLGLLLGFTFFASLSKHEDRRQTILADSNSIRVFYTSVLLLKDPEKTQLQVLVRRYTEIDLELLRSAPTSEVIAKA